MKNAAIFAILLLTVCFGYVSFASYRKVPIQNRTVRYLPIRLWGFGETSKQVVTENCVMRDGPKGSLVLEIRTRLPSPEVRCGFFSTWTYQDHVVLQPMR